jgi:hypothetical protein
MKEQEALGWQCEGFNKVLLLVGDWLEGNHCEAPESLAQPKVVEDAVAEQRSRLEECLRAVCSPGRDEIPLEAVAHIVGSLLGAFEKLWQAYVRSRDRAMSDEDKSDSCQWKQAELKARDADLRVQELTMQLRASEQRLEEARASAEEAAARESEREMRLCRMMAQEARDAAQLREALRQSERAADTRASEEGEEKSMASAQLRRCQQDLSKAQRRNTELLKDLQLLCIQSRAERVEEAPVPATVEDFSLTKSLTSFFGGSQVASTPRGSRQGSGGGGEASAKAAGGSSSTPRGSGNSGGATPRSTGGVTPRGTGKGGTTPKGMPGSMRELAQILAPQTLVKVDPSSHEARAVQLQKLVRDLTADLQERDARLHELTRELRRHRSSSACLEALDERGLSEPITEEMPTGPLSARDTRAEGGYSKPKMKRLSLPLRSFHDEEDSQNARSKTAQSAR